MYILERRGDVFSAEDEGVFFAHCISADFALGAGIAVEFNRRFDMRNKLRKRFPNGAPSNSCCIKIDNVLNLVTKKQYWEKPTEQSLGISLMAMAKLCRHHGVKNIAMPRIGCGIDGLQWERVREIISKVFANDDISITVFYL